MPAPQMTPEIQSRLYHETDARFWAQTGYKPGRHLDPNNTMDAHMMPVWRDIYAKVHAEWAKGKLVTTYDHPVVTGLITEAAHELQNAADSMGAAFATPSSDPIGKNAHAADAADAHARANAATAKASTYQPATASPQLAHDAALNLSHEIAATNAVAAQAVANGLAHSTMPEATPAPAAPPPPMPPRDVIDAMQVAYAPEKAAAAQVQTPAPDAPQPTKSSTGKTIMVAGALFAILMGAALLDKSGAPDMRARRGY